jgi:hypothetical protein
MRYVLGVGAPLAVALAAVCVCSCSRPEPPGGTSLTTQAPEVAGGALRSGPQPGQWIGGPFNPLNVTGPQAGYKTCQV